MVTGFWSQLKRPILLLAPMAGVTDTAFRRIVSQYGKPDVCFTEFVSCAGLCSAGRERLLPDLWYHESERPVVAQIFGPEPEEYIETAKLCRDLGFDGIDINFGCPDKNVDKQQAGAAIIQNPERAKAIIRATQKAAGNLPVTVKTRLGYDKVDTVAWTEHLLETEPVAITLHARTRNEMSKVPARWEEFGVATEVRDAHGADTMIFGNGDIMSVQQAEQLCETYGADGMMLGRAIFGNPWLFNRHVERDNLPVRERLRVLLQHCHIFEEVYGGVKQFAVLRKYFKSYVSGMPDAKELRARLLSSHTVSEVEETIAAYLDLLGPRADFPARHLLESPLPPGP